MTDAEKLAEIKRLLFPEHAKISSTGGWHCRCVDDNLDGVLEDVRAVLDDKSGVVEVTRADLNTLDWTIQKIRAVRALVGLMEGISEAADHQGQAAARAAKRRHRRGALRLQRRAARRCNRGAAGPY